MVLRIGGDGFIGIPPDQLTLRAEKTNHMQGEFFSLWENDAPILHTKPPNAPGPSANRIRHVKSLTSLGDALASGSLLALLTPEQEVKN